MRLVSDETISSAYLSAVQGGLIDEQDTVVIFMDLSVLDDRLQRLKDSFPEGALHAVAVKTNPLAAVLRYIAGRGFGLEAASFGEVLLGLDAGLSPERMVFDSPAKTVAEIRHLAEKARGLRVNADSLAELERYPRQGGAFRLGLRINPLISAGSVASMDVSSADSKFGVPIDREAELIEACLGWADVECLHLHIGSQFSDLTHSVQAIRRVVDLGLKINEAAGFLKIQTIDIGGGFPVRYDGGPPYRIENYADALRKACPELFDASFRLVTEFGRYVHANACWALSRIEYVKSRDQGQTLITHAGADMFVRECYNPADWQVAISCIDHQGVVSTGGDLVADVAGPLCFGGDFIAKGRKLSRAVAGEHLVLRDIGANTFALWSRHCSRPFPKVIALSTAEDPGKVAIVKARESMESVIGFWS